VNTAVQNPEGETQNKFILYQMDEAHRYSIATGLGAQIGRIGGGSSLSALVRKDLDVRNSGVIVDADVRELVTETTVLPASIASHAMAQSFDASKPEMQQTSHSVVLIADHRWRRTIQQAESGQASCFDDACDRGATAAYTACDLSTGQPRSTKFHDPPPSSHPGSAGSAWPRRAVVQSVESFLPEPGQPLPSGAFADADGMTRFSHGPAIGQDTIN